MEISNPFAAPPARAQVRFPPPPPFLQLKQALELSSCGIEGNPHPLIRAPLESGTFATRAEAGTSAAANAEATTVPQVEPSSARRRLAAILSTDAAGFSRRMAEDDVATVETLRSHRDTIRALVPDCLHWIAGPRTPLTALRLA
jgi:hypothetical protein